MLLLATIISFIGNLVLGIYALKFNSKRAENRYFALFTFTVAVWIVVFYCSLVDYSLWLVRASMVLAAVWTYSLFLFAYAFTYQKVKKKLLYSMHAIVVFMSLLSLSPLVFSSSTIREGQPFPVPGSGMPLFFLYAVGFLIASTYLVTRNIWHKHPMRKHQAIFIAIGLNLTVITITFSNFISVLVFETRALFPLGMLSTLFFVGMTAYAMTRYRFLDVRVVFKKSLIYGGILFAITGIYVAAILAIYTWLKTQIHVNPLVWLTISLLVFVAFFEHFKVRLKYFLDGIFFVDDVQFVKIMQESNLILNSSHELETYVMQLAACVQKVTEAPVKQIFVRMQYMNRFKSFFPQQARDFLPFEEQTAQECEKKRGLFLKSELEEKPAIRKLMKKYQSEIYMTVGSRGEPLLAIVLVGEHKNRKPFAKRDMKGLKEFQQTAEVKFPILLQWQKVMEEAKVFMQRK